MFLVDVPTYAAVCDLGDPDAAAVYLILAAGTGTDNRTSTWSREAVNKRTGLNWRKADGCVTKLGQHGFVAWLTGKGTRKPRLDLPPIETRKPMQKHVAALADRIMHGEQPVAPKDKAAATIGKDQGWLAEDDDGTWRFIPNRPMVKAYLPNALVGDETGKATGTSTIVDRIRLSRDAMAFRLLADLYSLQDLAEHGGVDRQAFRKAFTRRQVLSTGQFRVWHFEKGQQWVSWQKQLGHHRREPTKAEKAEGKNAGTDFFGRVEVLQDAGALEWVYYLAEDGNETSTHVYPVAVERHGKMVWSELETIVGGYAIRAACALTNRVDEAKAWEQSMPNAFVLPADRLAREATLVGVPRLRCRAKTTNAARWRKELVEDAEGIVQMFRGIIDDNAPELLAEADRRFADFNVASTMTSTVVQRDINVPYQSTNNDIPELRSVAAEDDLVDSEGIAEMIERTTANLTASTRSAGINNEQENDPLWGGDDLFAAHQAQRF